MIISGFGQQIATSWREACAHSFLTKILAVSDAGSVIVYCGPASVCNTSLTKTSSASVTVKVSVKSVLSALQNFSSITMVGVGKQQGAGAVAVASAFTSPQSFTALIIASTAVGSVPEKSGPVPASNSPFR